MVIYNAEMLVTWDKKKNEFNFKKHGVWFEEAATVLFDSMALMNINKHPSGQRFEYFGHSDRSRLLYVVTVEKDDEEIRIISARRATGSERKEYEKGI